VLYDKDAGYSYVGVLSFLERMAKRPELVDYGIYRSHPIDAERVASAKSAITKLGVPINRRQTTNATKAEVKTETVDGADVSGVAIGGKVIYRAAPEGGQTSAQKAQAAADKINSMLDANLQMHEIRVDPNGGGVMARDQAMLIVSDEDAKLMKTSAAEVSQSAAAAIRDVIWKQMVDTLH
jgi:hypothetical protein